jgi:hypothetical protein
VGSFGQGKLAVKGGSTRVTTVLLDCRDGRAAKGAAFCKLNHKFTHPFDFAMRVAYNVFVGIIIKVTPNNFNHQTNEIDV